MKNIKWYPRLVSSYDNGLLKHETIQKDSIIICRHTLNRDNSIYHSFAMFSPLYTFCKKMLSVEPMERTFFEVIRESQSQKPYFDIDIKNCNDKANAKVFIENLKKSILEDRRIKESDILVFSSHGKDKLSYHIIVNNWCLPDHFSNKVYCLKIIDRSLDHMGFKESVDRLVYTPGRQFRIFGNTKAGTKRFKILEGYEITERKDFMTVLYGSLITNTNSCKIIEYTPKSIKKYITDESELNPEELEIIKGLKIITESLFAIQEIKCRMILLKRLQPSYCELCKRIHETENPFLRFSSDSSTIYLNCRRSNGVQSVLWTRPANEFFMKNFLGK